MKFKAIILSIPMLALICTVVYGEVNTLQFSRVEGVVTSSTNSQLTIETSEDNSYNVLFSDDTLFVRSGEIIEAENIQLNDQVIVVYENNDTTGYEEVKATAVLLQGASFSNIFVGTFILENGGLLATDNGLRLPITDLLVYDLHGEVYESNLEELSGANLAVVFSASTLSIPPIPIMPTIFMLGMNEDILNDVSPMQEEEDNDIEVEPAPSLPINNRPQTQNVRSFLDYIPFWAGGNLGDDRLKEYEKSKGPQASMPFTSPSALYGSSSASANNIAEIVEEEIIDDSYFIGIEILIEELEELAEEMNEEHEGKLIKA